MNIFFILLRSSSDESSLLVKVIIAILALAVGSIIRANKKGAAKKKTDSKTADTAPIEPVAKVNNDQLDNILKNQSKIDQMKNTDDDSIWEDDNNKK